MEHPSLGNFMGNYTNNVKTHGKALPNVFLLVLFLGSPWDVTLPCYPLMVPGSRESSRICVKPRTLVILHPHQAVRVHFCKYLRVNSADNYKDNMLRVDVALSTSSSTTSTTRSIIIILRGFCYYSTHHGSDEFVYGAKISVQSAGCEEFVLFPE